MFIIGLFKNEKEEVSPDGRKIIEDFVKAKHYAIQNNIGLIEAFKKLKLGDYKR